ncbi:uncharacterized protein EAE98_003493 [Botrytis deweyae]|uniref:Uncharacterized protein n=1 Tax=Botrytis deweyae TaxID=2478750 RepID=A0ABQ7ITP1_9HELO|nr:uncharacterized protein EAE98_003493 [Botrytis deweyae]KAF7933784.1 hypothetical protein EAE98_003493 [Botrytis deweyae]
MHSSDPCARTELPGLGNPENPLSPVSKQERLDSPTSLDKEYYTTNMPGECAETGSELLTPNNRSHSSKRKGKRHAEMKIPRVRKRNTLKSYVTEALASDSEIGDLDSILEGAPRSKMQYQDQQTRSRGENVLNVATTAPPSENIIMSLDMSTGSSKEPQITLTIPAAFKKYNITIIHGNTTSNYTVNGEATASTPRHAPEQISFNAFKNLPVNPTASEQFLKWGSMG